MPNQATATYDDKSNREAGIILNRKHLGVMIITEQNGFDITNWYYIQLANIHNQSNPLAFKAKTLKGLIGKINRHKFELVRF